MSVSCALLIAGERVSVMLRKRKNWVQPSEVAEYFDVTAFTIHQWISNGTLRAARLPTGHLRILARDVIKFLLQKGKPIPGELTNLSNKHVLIIDTDRIAAREAAAALRTASGCKVTVAESAPETRGLLDGTRPDLVVLGVRRPAFALPHDGISDMFILGVGTDAPPAEDSGEQELTFRINEILPAPLDSKLLVSRVAHALLG